MADSDSESIISKEDTLSAESNLIGNDPSPQIIKMDNLSTMYNSVEQELWKIFSFYAIHSDATQPEYWKLQTFVKFVRDSQMMSKRVTVQVIELEVANLSRGKKNTDKSTATTEILQSINIDFRDFLTLLSIFSIKVYPRDLPDIALRRLLLENVLLLANRRIPWTNYFNLKDPAALKLLNESCKKSISGIFDYYNSEAERRRNVFLSSEAQKRTKTALRIQSPRGGNKPTPSSNLNATSSSSSSVGGSSTPLTSLSMTSGGVGGVGSDSTGGSKGPGGLTFEETKELFKSQRELIGYQEYCKFCLDFSLRSTSLLTSIQVGEIFLQTVPYEPAIKGYRGMSYEAFSQSLMCMAIFAFRDADPRVTPEFKVKALLLFMWKAINDKDRVCRRMREEPRSNIFTNRGGALNVFGAGYFSTHFLRIWQKDGFMEYTAPWTKETQPRGLAVFQAVTGESSSSNNSTINPSSSSSSPLLSSTSSSLKLTTKSNPPTSDEEGDENENDVGENEEKTSPTNQHPSSSMSSSSSMTDSESPLPSSLTIHGGQLLKLFELRPEIAEFVYLELQTFKEEEAKKKRMFFQNSS